MQYNYTLTAYRSFKTAFFLALVFNVTGLYANGMKTIDPPPTYCSASVTTGGIEYISQVTVNGIANNSGRSNYSNFTSVSFDAVVSSSNPITISLDSFPIANDKGYVWVDWNQDGDFDDASESIPLTVWQGIGPYSGNINVPATALLGPTRMRIRMNDEPVSGSCGNSTYGEVEDYTINVIDRRYVKQGGTGNGTSWASASGDLQAMINSVTPGYEVWVAGGTYQPGAGQSFAMRQNVKIYGGFPATGSPVITERNWAIYTTTLAGNGNRVIDNNANGLTNAAVLDGFIVTDGVAAGNGGGIHNFNAYPLLINCIFKDNTATNMGGAIYNEGNGSTLIKNCLVRDNTAMNGAAVADNNAADTRYVNITFAANTALQYGGAIYTNANSTVVGYNSIFWNNTATLGGNHLYSAGGGSVTLNYSLIDPSGANIGGTYAGSNNISGDPRFNNAAANDYTLYPASPAINAGSTVAFTNAITSRDLAGSQRLFANGIIDIGAYEYRGNTQCAAITTWNGTAWDNGAPDSNVYTAIIAGNFSSTGNLTACSLTVNSGTVTVNSGHNFIIKGAVTVAGGSITFEDNANLVQEDNVANTGAIVYKKTGSLLHYLDYTIWSSPTTGSQTLKQFSAQTLDERFYVYNTALGLWSNFTAPSGVFGGNPSAVTFTKAKGYLIRMPDGLSQASISAFEGIFSGVPNNGNIAIAAPAGFNAVGNPYPSPINVHNFIDANNTVLDNGGTIYFWRKTNDPAETTYATLNKLAYVKNEAPGGDTGTGYFNSGQEANWVINPGQGFLVKSLGGSINFVNTMRRTVNTGQFFRTTNNDTEETPEVSRYWLNITGASGGFGEMAVGYTAAATPGLDYGLDATLVNDGAAAIYSLAGTTKLAIQARPAFVNTDVVTLGYRTATAGTYTISLAQSDGLFSNEQTVYLKDNSNGIVHNLKESAYSFTTTADTFANRFEVVYALSALGTDVPVYDRTDVVIYKQGNALHIDSKNTSIDDISIYDIRGRLLYQNGINAPKTVISGLNVQQEVLIVKVKTAEGLYISKKIIY